ncbi:MAG: hypothetical protein CW338_09420 [Clostridiales bacterium]|nr:hypothetical protein [Clostridiales bacterium]
MLPDPSAGEDLLKFAPRRYRACGVIQMKRETVRKSISGGIKRHDILSTGGVNMIEYKVIDLDHYPRRAHLDYFMGMEHPQFNITAEVDITELYRFCKKEKCSFFLSFLHIAALSADSIPQLRQRIHRFSPEELKLRERGGGPRREFEIREYAQCPTSHTEAAGNELYCYCALYHHMPWEEYIRTAAEQQKLARERGSLEEDKEIEAFYFPTCLPWIHYTEVAHPMTDRFDSNPRFSWGKFAEDFRGRMMMPLTVAAHHGLVDGIHVGKFYANVEKNIIALTEGRPGHSMD